MYEDIKFQEGEDAIIGKGAFGVVRLAHYQGETVAVKQVKVAASKAFWKEEDAKAVKDFVSEIAIMSPLRHPNIIFFYGGVWLEGASRMCLVVEYAGRGSESHWRYWGRRLDGIGRSMMIGTLLCFRSMHLIFPLLPRAEESAGGTTRSHY